jgi:antitoxin YefM
MTTVAYTETKNRFASIWVETITTREPVVINRPGHESVVIVPASEWQGLLETIHLLLSPANSKRLLNALNRLEQV